MLSSYPVQEEDCRMCWCCKKCGSRNPFPETKRCGSCKASIPESPSMISINPKDDALYIPPLVLDGENTGNRTQQKKVAQKKGETEVLIQAMEDVSKETFECNAFIFLG